MVLEQEGQDSADQIDPDRHKQNGGEAISEAAVGRWLGTQNRADLGARFTQHRCAYIVSYSRSGSNVLSRTPPKPGVCQGAPTARSHLRQHLYVAALGHETQDRARDARDAIELLVEVLSGREVDLDRAGFYSRLAEGVCRIARMRAAVIFRFDEVTRRVEVAGAHGIGLERFADFPVSLELAPDAARALNEDRVIEVSPPARDDPRLASPASNPENASF